ncbi:MAG: DUF4190 domain-containing protein [Aeromicrobium sp.]
MSSGGPQYPQYPGQDPDEGRPPPHTQPPPGAPPPPPPPGPQWPPAAYGQTTPPPAPGQAPTNNSKAIWSLVLGIAGLVCCGLIAGIPAIILATQAKREIALAAGQQSGGGMATAGLVLGIIATALSAVYVILLAAIGTGA